MSSFLAYLWHSYINYLWNYDSNSWVATIAYAFRIWAILAILPTLVLALLVSISPTRRSYSYFVQDVTSYVIARTLGDPTASTSHKSSFVTKLPPKSESKIANIDSASPTALAVPVPVPVPVPPQGESPSGISTKPTPAPTPAPSTGVTSPPRAFFVDGEGSEDDGAARLAGVGVFSPVASMPGSPTVSRRNLLEKEGEDDGGGIASGSDESGSSSAAPRGVLLSGKGGHQHQHQHQNHHHGGREAETETGGGRDGHEHTYGHERAASDGDGVNGGGGSTSGESSFAMLDREESFEEAGVHIRRRVPGVAAADE